MIGAGRNRQLVDGGRVWCPLRGDVDSECCWTCRHLRAVERDEVQVTIVCRPPTDLVGEAMAALVLDRS